MAELNFPSNPTVGQVHTVGLKSWEWTGFAWRVLRTQAAGKSAYESAVELGFVGTEAQWIASLKGAKGDTGDQGPQGQTGQRGVQGDPGDRGADGTNGTNGTDGEGVPAGGSPGQVLTKATGANYDTIWVTPDYLSDYTVPLGGNQGQFLGKTSATDGAFAWLDLPAGGEGSPELPNGGNQGQVLTKASATSGDVIWADQTGGNGVPDGGTTGQVLTKNSNMNGDATWQDASGGGSAEYPDMTGNAGKVLKVNSSADGVEWANDLTGGDDLPSTVGQAGKVLKVNSSETGIEWSDDLVGSMLPSLTSHEGDILAVNQTATGVQWIDAPKGIPSGGAEGQVLSLDVSGNPVWAEPYTGELTYVEKHQYWRLIITANNGDGFSGLSELQLRSEIGGSSVAIGGTPIGSLGNPGNAFDGLTNTYSSSFGSSNHWVGYNFGAGNKQGIIEVAVGSAEYLNQTPRNFIIQYSDNGTDWINAWTVTNQTGWTGGELRVFADPDPAYYEPDFVEDVDNDGKVYSRKNGAWVEAKINDLTDVDTLTTTPTQGQTLFYDESVNIWKPGTITFPAQNAMGFAWQLEATGTGSSQQITIPYPNLEPWQVMMFENGSKVRASQYNIVDDKVVYTATNGSALELLGPAIILDGTYSNQWRLYATTIDGGTALASIAELYLYTGSQGNPNDIAPTGTPTQSSQYSSFGPANFTDRNTGTFSSLNTPPSSYLPGWWQVTFGSSKKIIGFGIMGRQSELNNTPKDFLLQYWDGTTWQTLITITNQTGWGAARRDFFL